MMAEPADRPFSYREAIVVVCGFAGLTLALTYPQIRVLSSGVGDHYDALFGVWRLAWIAHQALRDPSRLFDANIFYPSLKTLAYSDATLLQAAMGAPLIWLGMHPVTVYNLLLLFSFVACGAAMYLLVRRLTLSPLAAWFAGVVFAFQPNRFGHYAQLETLWSWPIPLAFWAFDRLLVSRRVRDGVWLGLFVALQAWSCLYYALFLVTALGVILIVTMAGRAWSETAAIIKPMVVAIALATVLAGPYVVPYLSNTRTVGTRTEQDVRDWSPTPIQYLTTTSGNWLYGRVMSAHEQIEWIMFPGSVAVGLAAAALWPPFSRRRLAYGLVLVVAFDLSLGVHGVAYGVLYRLVWAYRGMRVPARMFVIVSAALAVLGGDGIARVLARATSLRWRRAIGTAIVALTLLESAAMPIRLQEVEASPPRIYTWLRTHPPSVVMEWPMPLAASLGITHEPQYMYYSTFHWQRLVNGYSGFYPTSYIHVVEHVETFPSPESVGFLRQVPVDYIVLHSRFDPDGYRGLRLELDRRGEFERLIVEREGTAEIAVYRLRPADSTR